VKRLEGGQRVYTEDDVRRLKFIQKLKVLGLSLAEMQELETLYGRHHTNDKVLPRLIELLDSHLTTVGERLRELSALRDEIRSYKQHVTKRLEEAK
jgi:MerR family transcriptional regulator, repressor of the yfmOP operon